jgi:hypothetical protein
MEDEQLRPPAPFGRISDEKKDMIFLLKWWENMRIQSDIQKLRGKIRADVDTAGAGNCLRKLLNIPDASQEQWHRVWSAFARTIEQKSSET